MGLPRYKYVKKGEEGVYHTWSKTVRRAFLFGYDPVSKRDYSYRKIWIVEHLKFLASIFAIDVCAFAVMINHLHTILRTLPSLADGWSDYEVASRWVRLHPNKSIHPDIQIQGLLQSPELIQEIRLKLSDLSVFMKRLNEYIARRANKEDEMTGAFFDRRFRSRALADVPAITCCMVYVDLNPVRAGIAPTPEDSDFTSIQARIQSWKEHMADIYNEHWLCPIQSTPTRRGILDISEKEYIELVDRTGRMIRADKPGYIDPDLPPILSRIGVIPKAWDKTIEQFDRFRIAAGTVSSLNKFASRIGQKWVKGISLAKAAFG
jgi:REP element-mobilizing transposase RayT